MDTSNRSQGVTDAVLVKMQGSWTTRATILLLLLRRTLLLPGAGLAARARLPPHLP